MSANRNHCPSSGTDTMPQTIIWDWNGTLLNDAAVCLVIINQVLARRGLPTISRAHYMAKFGFPVRDYYAQLGFDFSREPFEVIGSEFIASYEERRLRLRLQPGARSLLARLHGRGVDQLVLSAYRHDTLESLLQAKRVRHYFTRIVGADDVYAAGKVEQGRHLMRLCRLDPASTLMVGDTVHDYEVATAMGIRCVLLDAGHQTRSRLAACGVPVLDNLTALAGWLGVVSA